jgi:hypothetical protein
MLSSYSPVTCDLHLWLLSLSFIPFIPNTICRSLRSPKQMAGPSRLNSRSFHSLYDSISLLRSEVFCPLLLWLLDLYRKESVRTTEAPSRHPSISGSIPQRQRLNGDIRHAIISNPHG